jgi:hypothetical protein
MVSGITYMFSILGLRNIPTFVLQPNQIDIRKELYNEWRSNAPYLCNYYPL